MCSNGTAHTHAPQPPADRDQQLSLILEAMDRLSASNESLRAKVDELSAKQGNIADPRITSPSVLLPSSLTGGPSTPPSSLSLGSPRTAPSDGLSTPLSPTTAAANGTNGVNGDAPKKLYGALERKRGEKGEATVEGLYPQRVILTTYPGQVGVNPVPLVWGAKDVVSRGPVVASRHPSSLKVRNAIGAYSGSYSIYKALAIALDTLDPNHKPDYTNTHPPFDLPPQPAWFDKKKIVSLDPWGHVVQTQFKEQIDAGLDARPTISCTRAHIKMSELDAASLAGSLPIDGKVVQRSPVFPAFPDREPGIEVNVSKAAVEPVWHLPGMAERFGISEDLLRRALFEETGGMYPELLTRRDLDVFLPPIGGLTVYIFGNPAFMSDPTKELTLRVHDECNGSDVFGSDICTCRPYLIYGIEEAARCAQRGGVGVIVYFRKEGRALGEVTKYLVYNSRKRGGDSADRYFKSTELIAGVKDMRFQALMPDVLHWLGITKVDNMISMSDMKYDAIVNSGIEIRNRYDLPLELTPPDAMVEMDAKIVSGYGNGSRLVKPEDLHKTVGRAWEDLEH